MLCPCIAVVYAPIDFECDGEEDGCRDEAADGVDEIVCTDVHRSAAEQDIQWQEYPERTLSEAVSEQHDNRAHAHMARRECRSGSLSAFLGERDEASEESASVRSRGRELYVGAEIVVELRVLSGNHGFVPNGGEIVIRPCYGQENVDGVVEEETDEYDRHRLAQVFALSEKCQQDTDDNHREISEITGIEQLTPYFTGKHLAEHDGRLAAKQFKVDAGEDVVQVGELPAELIRFGVPIGQQEQECYLTYEVGRLCRAE